VFYTREEAAKNSARGEQGETEGMLKFLLGLPDTRIVYFGPYRGEPLPGLTVIEPNISGLSHESSGAEQRQCWAEDAKRVAEFEPVMYIQMSGYAATRFSLDNDAGASVQACGVRYVAPPLALCQYLKLPRIVVNTDPRTYPREIEMTEGWDYIVPAALLSQRDMVWDKTIGGIPFKVHEVYSGAENWCEHVSVKREKTVPCTVVAHAHIQTGCKFKGRNTAWWNVLNPWDDVVELWQRGMRVYGEGWEFFDNYSADVMPGPINPARVMEVLAEAYTCPAVAAGNKFYTAKLRTCLTQNCLPLFYGRGQDFTFDPLERYLPLDSPLRINEPGDLLKVVNYFERHPDVRQEEVDRLWRASMPNFSKLQSCIDDFMNGMDIQGTEWLKKYGGYRRV
jgi:hypothetical protein